MRDWRKKIQTIRHAIELHRPDPDDVIDVLSKVGGLDIAGLVGVFSWRAACRVPIVIDGFLHLRSSCACAARMEPKTKDFMMASHLSQEPASAMVLGGTWTFRMPDVRYASGRRHRAVTLYPILDIALAVYNGMSTFEEKCHGDLRSGLT